MATAVEPAASPKSVEGSDRLLPLSLLAATLILGGVALVGYAIPKLLVDFLPGNSFISTFLRIGIQIAAIVGLVYAGGKLAGARPPRGLRGGIFITISVFFTVFFLWRAIGLNFTSEIGKIIGIVLTLVLIVFAVRFLFSRRARDWMIALEDLGLFHTYSYKRTQGLRMRRYTIIGILLVGLSGVWALMNQGLLGSGDLMMRMPYLDRPVAVLADVQYAIPLLLVAAIFWFAWRAVNVPPFADFLIATEAEMNKVSWTPRRRLLQDTIVVLTTTLLLTAFLLVIDLFWGWLLSLSFIGVLPNKDTLDTLKKKDVPTKQLSW